MKAMQLPKTFATLVAALLPLTTLLAQGPLTPPVVADAAVGPVNALTPGGAPQAAMKTLHQVEPRTPIPGGSSTVTLNQPGSYYLTGGLVVASGDGIVINASNITLDLNGLSITSTAAVAEGTGIRLGNGLIGISLRNGSVGTIAAGGFIAGVQYVMEGGFPQPPRNVRVADLSVVAKDHGITLSFSAHIERCMVLGGSASAIAGTVVRDCVAEGGSISGSVVKDCVASTTGPSAISGQVVEGCVGNSLGTGITGRSVANSYATGGGSQDVVSAGVVQNVWAEGGSGSGDGIEANVVGNAYAIRRSDLGGASTGTGVNAQVAINVEAASGGRGIRAFALGNATSEGGGNVNMVDSLVAHNVVSRGGSGQGNAIAAPVVGNSMVFRSGSLPGNSSGRGIVGEVVSDSFARGHGGGGIVASAVNACYAFDNRSVGILAHTVVGSSARAQVTGSGFGTGIDAGSVLACSADLNEAEGVLASLVAFSNTTHNGKEGVRISNRGLANNSFSDGGVVFGSNALFNGRTGFDANGGVVGHSTAMVSGQAGIYAHHGVVGHSIAGSNTGEGILASQGVVVDSRASSNGDWGISGEYSVISRCLAKDNSHIADQHGGILASFANISFCHSFSNDSAVQFSEYEDYSLGWTLNFNR